MGEPDRLWVGASACFPTRMYPRSTNAWSVACVVLLVLKRLRLESIASRVVNVFNPLRLIHFRINS